MITINNDIRAGWHIKNNDVESFSKRIVTLFELIDEVIVAHIDYSAYYDSGTNIVINVSAKQVSITYSQVEQLYDLIVNLINKADIPEDQKNSILYLIQEGKSELNNTSKFKQVLEKIHHGFSKYSSELSVLSTIFQFII